VIGKIVLEETETGLSEHQSSTMFATSKTKLRTSTGVLLRWTFQNPLVDTCRPSRDTGSESFSC
jgi:hypothetical protein